MDKSGRNIRMSLIVYTNKEMLGKSKITYMYIKQIDKMNAGLWILQSINLCHLQCIYNVCRRLDEHYRFFIKGLTLCSIIIIIFVGKLFFTNIYPLEIAYVHSTVLNN